jgi:hypothetical protein
MLKLQGQAKIRAGGPYGLARGDGGEHCRGGSSAPSVPFCLADWV